MENKTSEGRMTEIRGLQGGAQVQGALLITLFTVAVHGSAEVEEIVQRPAMLCVSRVSTVTLTPLCTHCPAGTPSCPNPGREGGLWVLS